MQTSGKIFGGAAIRLDRSDINTDEIIPARYLTEISKSALRPHLLEDLLIDGKPFDHQDKAMTQAKVVIARQNFGCGSSREHAVWAFEVNDINVVIASGFARIFRQNMFNCGILAVQLTDDEIDRIFAMKGKLTVTIDLEKEKLQILSDHSGQQPETFSFSLNTFDHDLVAAGGWLSYADSRY